MGGWGNIKMAEKINRTYECGLTYSTCEILSLLQGLPMYKTAFGGNCNFSGNCHSTIS
jgi:hypothetical protein